MPIKKGFKKTRKKEKRKVWMCLPQIGDNPLRRTDGNGRRANLACEGRWGRRASKRWRIWLFCFWNNAMKYKKKKRINRVIYLFIFFLFCRGVCCRCAGPIDYSLRVFPHECLNEVLQWLQFLRFDQLISHIAQKGKHITSTNNEFLIFFSNALCCVWSE